MMDFCIVADPLPGAAGKLDLIDTDYRHMIRFEAAMLRVKNEQEAGPLITRTLDAFLGAGWQAEYTVQEAFNGCSGFTGAARNRRTSAPLISAAASLWPMTISWMGPSSPQPSSRSRAST